MDNKWVDEPKNDPEWDRYVKHVRETLVPKIEGSSIFISITPGNPKQVDVKFAVELGLAIMYDKPIIAVIAPGTKIPEKLARVVEKFVELENPQDPTGRERLIEAITEMMDEEKQKKGGDGQHRHTGHKL
jgi:hypothetical protein